MTIKETVLYYSYTAEELTATDERQYTYQNIYILEKNCAASSCSCKYKNSCD